ncbi:hypothetical protein F5X96DRAFT_659090 [Biscogniauxia mediterranea]|nr:hypothetical protein F5X96DRAFT_659090 [Biscogniauxia mediterranea]
MQFSTVLVLALSSLAAGASSRTSVQQDAAVYAQKVAPAQLSRVGQFKAAHAGNLTSAQTSFLDDVAEAIGAPGLADIPGLEKACAAVFGDAECAAVLAGKTTSKVRRAGLGDMLGRRATACECSDGSDWCNSGYQCARSGEDNVDCAIQGGRKFEIPSSISIPYL